MCKKLYSLLASILILTACSVDQDFEDIIDNGDPSRITLSFNLDIPSAAVVTKAATLTDAMKGENGVDGLKLYTFDASGVLIEMVEPTPLGEQQQEDGSFINNYRAVISKDTRSIHFISNYEGSGLDAVDHVDDIYAFDTNEYVFWGVKNYTEQPTNLLGTVELFRNWSKLELENTSTMLSEVSYMVYSQSTNSMLAFTERDKIALPENLTWDRPAQFSKTPLTDPSYIFENDNQVQTGTFLIVEGKYDNAAEFTYYKIDLSVPQSTGVVKIYDVIRNHHFKVKILNVATKGVTWDEVISEDKIPDNNITASAELNEYPKITFGGETLEVSKTTYLFTQAGMLNMQADYYLNGTKDNSKLKLVQVPADINNVVDGEIALSGTGAVTATIRTPGETKQTAKFYIKGGALQRMITLVLRPAYDFKAFTIDPPVSDVDSEVTAHFEVPDDIERSIFPLEFKFTANKLYAVEPGVRIEPGGNGSYTYIYTAQSYQANGYDVKFKSNITAPGTWSLEIVTLSAQYFNPATADVAANIVMSNFDVRLTTRTWFILWWQYHETRASEVTTDNPDVRVISNGNGENRRYKFIVKHKADLTKPVTLTATFDSGTYTRTYNTLTDFINAEKVINWNGWE